MIHIPHSKIIGIAGEMQAPGGGLGLGAAEHDAALHIPQAEPAVI